MCFQNLREKSLAYPQATREELLRHLRELLEVTTEEKHQFVQYFLKIGYLNPTAGQFFGSSSR